MPDWTPEVFAALGVCPPTWTETDPPGRFTMDAGGGWLEFQHEGDADSQPMAYPEFMMIACIEKHWREECERRGVQFAFRNGKWNWLWAAGEVNYGESPVWLLCLADAILNTQPKEEVGK